MIYTHDYSDKGLKAIAVIWGLPSVNKESQSHYTIVFLIKLKLTDF